MATPSPCLILLSTMLLAGAVDPNARPFASAEAARELVYLLDGMGLHAMAAADPTEPGTFVAALYIPRSRLLVVRARHPSVEGVAHHLATRQYRDVYLDLQGSPTPGGKFFVQDAGADGILSALPGGGDVDVLYEDGVQSTLFNGDSRGQNLTPAEYDAKLQAADAYYARLLKLLTTALQQDMDSSERSSQ